MQIEKKVLLAIVVLLWFPFYVVIQQWQISVSVYVCMLYTYVSMYYTIDYD